MTTVTVTEQKTTVTATNTGANVTLAGVQGPAGPSKIAGKVCGKLQEYQLV